MSVARKVCPIRCGTCPPFRARNRVLWKSASDMYAPSDPSVCSQESPNPACPLCPVASGKIACATRARCVARSTFNLCMPSPLYGNVLLRGFECQPLSVRTGEFVEILLSSRRSGNVCQVRCVMTPCDVSVRSHPARCCIASVKAQMASTSLLKISVHVH